MRSISIIFFLLRFLETATIGVEQNKPIFTPGVIKAACSDATAKSQLATNWHPAAAAIPQTSAITGWGKFMIVCIKFEHSLNNSLKNFLLFLFFLNSSRS